MNENLATLLKGAVGGTGSLVAVLLPWQEHLEWSIKIAGGVAGLVVAVLTIISLVKGLTK